MTPNRIDLDRLTDQVAMLIDRFDTLTATVRRLADGKPEPEPSLPARIAGLVTEMLNLSERVDEIEDSTLSAHRRIDASTQAVHGKPEPDTRSPWETNTVLRSEWLSDLNGQHARLDGLKADVETLTDRLDWIGKRLATVERLLEGVLSWKDKWPPIA